MLVAVIVILILFVLVIGNNTLMQQSTDMLSYSIDNKKKCIEFAFLMSEVYAGGKGTVLKVETIAPYTIKADQKTLTINGESCYFLVPTTDKTVNSGTVKIENVGNEIVLSNV
jgi:hypothetical protein